VGKEVGDGVGPEEGLVEGSGVGSEVGHIDGLEVGGLVGLSVRSVGFCEGEWVG